MRHQFIGEEIIGKTSGKLTKRYQKKQIISVLVMSSPIFIILLLLTILFFNLILKYKEANPYFIQETFANTLYGIILVLLEQVYKVFAYSTTNKENHKYPEQYEKSLVYKIFMYKFLSAFQLIFYVSFLKKDTDFTKL